MSERDDRREERSYSDKVAFRGRCRQSSMVVPRLPWLEKETREGMHAGESDSDSEAGEGRSLAEVTA